jgi:Folylpolyglutamate synthase
MNKSPVSYNECLKEMFALGRFGIKLELDTVKAILNKLGSPEQNIKTIHIAGTNGKGSIASYIASVLIHSGFNTGLYTSPHLVSFNERFTINKAMASDEDIVEAYHAVKAADTGDRKKLPNQNNQ